MDQMTMCNVKGKNHSEKPTEIHHLTLQLPSALGCVLGCFSLLFWFYGCNCTARLTDTALINLFSSCRQPFSTKSSKTHHCALP